MLARAIVRTTSPSVSTSVFVKAATTTRLFHKSPNKSTTYQEINQQFRASHNHVNPEQPVASSRILASTATSNIPTTHDNFHKETNSPVARPQQHTSSPIPGQHPPVPDTVSYLKDYKVSELFSYFCIGLVTLNKPILNFCIKLFPYVPMFIIKKLVYKVYCGGETVADLFKTSERLTARGINNMMLSLTIEAAEGTEGDSHIDPNYIVQETNKSITDFLIPNTIQKIKQADNINSIPPSYVALKPTGFAANAAEALRNYKHNPQFDDLVGKISEIVETVYENNLKLSKLYPERVAPMAVAVIDAEKHDLQEGVYELQRRLYKKFNKLNEPISVVGTLQMYLQESSDLLALEERLAVENNYRLGLKLVRGAYIHSEKKRDSIIHTTKDATDLNYNQGITYCIENILADTGNESTLGHLVVASHNSESLNLATDKLNQCKDLNHNKNNIVLGQLLGMADNITYNLIKDKNVNNVIKYVPWGPPVETKAYLLRRLEENGDAVKNDTGFNLIKAVVTVLYRRVVGTA